MHPASRHSSLSSFEAEAVRAMIGVCGQMFARSSARISLVALQPSSTGICISLITTSNSPARNSSTPSRP